MASSTKYQPAPQRDSFEEQRGGSSYTQAPPSYDTLNNNDIDIDHPLGAPRSEDDNVPDDFKVCSISSTSP